MRRTAAARTGTNGFMSASSRALDGSRAALVALQRRRPSQDLPDRLDDELRPVVLDVVAAALGDDVRGVRRARRELALKLEPEPIAGVGRIAGSSQDGERNRRLPRLLGEGRAERRQIEGFN